MLNISFQRSFLFSLLFGSLYLISACTSAAQTQPQHATKAAPSIQKKENQKPIIVKECTHFVENKEISRAKICLEQLTTHADKTKRYQANILLGQICFEEKNYPSARRYYQNAINELNKPSEAPHIQLQLTLCDIKQGYLKAAFLRLEKIHYRDLPKSKHIDYWGAKALCAKHEQKHSIALDAFYKYYQLSERPIEKDFAKQNLLLLLNQLSDQKLQDLLDSYKEDNLLLALIINERLHRHSPNQNNLVIYEDLKKRHYQLLKRFDLQSKEKRTIVLVISRSGRYRQFAKLALNGVSAALSLFEKSHRKLRLILVDSSKKHEHKRLRKLLAKQDIIGIMGAFDPKSTPLIANIAAQNRVPFVAISKAKPTNKWQLNILPPLSLRIESLSRALFAKNKNPKSLLFCPQSALGRKSCGLFQNELKKKNITPYKRIDYPIQMKSFSKLVKTLEKRFDTVFIADSATKVGLIAPALAAHGFWSNDLLRGSLKKKHYIQIIATADLMNENLIRSAGNYLQGALFAPGFYPAIKDHQTGPMLRDFQSKIGKTPTMVEAYSYDAASLLKQASDQKLSEYSFIQKFKTAFFSGMTGRIQFSPNGDRMTPPPVYTIKENDIKIAVY